MLSESSYFNAIFTYIIAACAAVVFLGWWLSRYARAGWVALAVLLSAALLLTPAHPNAGVLTFAPALIVALFESMTSGVESARHAFKPLVFMLTLAVVLAIVLQLLVFRRWAVGNKHERTPGQSD